MAKDDDIEFLPCPEPQWGPSIIEDLLPAQFASMGIPAHLLSNKGSMAGSLAEEDRRMMEHFREQMRKMWGR